MEFQTSSSPYPGVNTDVSRVMRQVLYALVPGSVAAIGFFGWGVLINILLAVGSAVAMEAAVLKLRHKPVVPALADNSAIITGWLLALALPPLVPWWLIITGVFFAIVVAKQLYGGLGYNPFNPAMVGYVVLLISFPVQMTSWLPPFMLAEHSFSFFQSLGIVFSGQLPDGLSWDAVTMATPLDTVKTEARLNNTISEIRQNPLFGNYSGKGWEWVANGFAVGGIWLIYKRIIPWQIPVTMLLALGIPSGIIYLSNPDHFASPAFHIFSGGAILGAFFIVTDPVSGSATPKGRIIFAAGVGFLTFIIRNWGGYPEAIAFSVLLMNMATPLIDQYTQPRVFGKDQQ